MIEKEKLNRALDALLQLRMRLVKVNGALMLIDNAGVVTLIDRNADGLDESIEILRELKTDSEAL